MWFFRISDIIPLLNNPKEVRTIVMLGRMTSLRHFAYANSSLGAGEPVFTIKGVRDSFSNLHRVYARMYGKNHELASSFDRMIEEIIFTVWYNDLLDEAKQSLCSKKPADILCAQQVAACTTMELFNAHMMKWQKYAFGVLSKAYSRPRDMHALASRNDGLG
jgi:hypothetical protein